MTRLQLYLVLAACACAMMLALPVEAQSSQSGSTGSSFKPRFGIGFTTAFTTGDHLVGLGFQGRGTAPINADLSFAADVGFKGFVFEGREKAVYILEPQIALIVTLNAQNPQSPYVIGGLGGYIPVGSNAERDAAGPTLHGGIGFIRSLLTTSVFIEINPALVIERTSVSLSLPVRIGVVL